MGHRDALSAHSLFQLLCTKVFLIDVIIQFILFLECSLGGIKYLRCKIENEKDFHLWGHLALLPVTPILFEKFSSCILSRGLRPGSKVSSEHMNDWQYLLLGDLEQNEVFSKGKS